MAKHPKWNPSEPDLATFAEGHISYEIRNAIEQAISLREWPDNKPKTSEWDALLEAFLVHIHLLDDFLAKAPTGDDVAADHYVAGRPLRGFLNETEIDDLNAQVAHLAARRQVHRGWPVEEITDRLCDALEGFHNELDRQRRDYFQQIPHSLGRWRTNRARNRRTPMAMFSTN